MSPAQRLVRNTTGTCRKGGAFLCLGRGLLVWGGVLLAAGCASTTLNRPRDFGAVVGREPASIALGEIRDNVACDDEAFYLQRYLEGQRVFYDCVLADRSDVRAYHGADLIVSGKIAPAIQTRRLGWGVFASWITLGGYYLLGGPTREQEVRIAYDFEVEYADSGQSRNYRFEDVRQATFGLYGPGINLDQKPGVYIPGWERLLYEICKETKVQRAGRAP
ncbi:MAG: hypothetical protein KBC66_04475 [Kiritimatiellae bacterium]|jgi:hypothetical protein|nr:hypothetical protein [Kiritimatiellia bacterium]NLD89697.1 hypothetical protein [Lentisphaerota bacterium]HPC19267.1 hypothetical protein [Kiritimatiellia bacterium]HQN80892.1 hypothetical protein [Kiritimatiellia bacterium]HQQ60680.1 hypothetical protein [Kiritimatiellia bacterium]